MIVNDESRFVFVHIPKCAGTSVRNALSIRNDCRFAEWNRRARHRSLGYIDYMHLPLFTLREHFEGQFRRVDSYRSFAVVRDPFARFPSSVSQRLRVYADRPIQTLRDKEILKEVDRVIGHLTHPRRSCGLLAAEYIHFQRQIDYIQLDGEQIVESVYSIGRIDKLLDDIADYVGQRWVLRNEHDAGLTNQTVVYRSEFVGRAINATRSVRPTISGFLPQGIKQKFRSYAYVPRDERLSSLFGSEYIKDFVSDYYKRDIELVNDVERVQ